MQNPANPLQDAVSKGRTRGGQSDRIPCLWHHAAIVRGANAGLWTCRTYRVLPVPGGFPVHPRGSRLLWLWQESVSRLTRPKVCRRPPRCALWRRRTPVARSDSGSWRRAGPLSTLPGEHPASCPDRVVRGQGRRWQRAGHPSFEPFEIRREPPARVSPRHPDGLLRGSIRR